MSRRDYRLVIEGAPVCWATSIHLEGTLDDGRVCFAGLEFDGLKIQEDLSLKDSMVSSGGMTATIRHPQAPTWLAGTPVRLANYTATIPASTSLSLPITITVDDSSELSVGDVIHIGTEALLVDAIDGTSVDVYQCEWDTQKQTHYVSADFGTDTNYFTTVNAIYDRPFSLTRRRAYLFEYVDGAASDMDRIFDSTAGAAYGQELYTDDSLIWRGFVSALPTLAPDGLSWQLSLIGQESVLDQSIGRNDKYAPVGIYRPFSRGCGIQVCGVPWQTTTGWRITKHVDGFFEDTTAFLAAINVALDEIIDAQDPSNTLLTSMIIEETEGGYHIVIESSATSVEGDGFSIGFFDNGLGCRIADHEEQVWDWGWASGAWGNPTWASTNIGSDGVSVKLRMLLNEPGSTYYPIDKTGTLFPEDAAKANNWLGVPPANSDTTTRSTSEHFALDGPGGICTSTSSYPLYRVYVSEEFSNLLRAGDIVHVDSGGDTEDVIVSTVDTTDNYFTYSAGYNQIFLDESTTLQIVKLTVAGDVTDALADTTYGMTAHAHETDLGWYPFIVPGDFDPTSLTDCGTELMGRDYPDVFNNRDYGITEDVSVKNWLIEELKLIGYYCRLSTVGALELKKITAALSSLISITDDDIILHGSNQIRYYRNKYGIITSIKYTDKYRDAEQIYHILTTNSPYFKAKDIGTIVINPLSKNETAFDPTLHPTVFTDFEGQILNLFNKDYVVIDLPVKGSRRDDLRVGNWVVLNSDHIFNFQSASYGMDGVPGIVMGRSFNLDPKRSAVGHATIMIADAGSPFTTQWTVSGNESARTIVLPLVNTRTEGSLSYNCYVDWGDGTGSTVTAYNDSNITHIYAADGTYIVRIYGTCEGWSFNGVGSCLKCNAVIDWGSAPFFNGFKYLKGGFYLCPLTSIPENGIIPASGTGILSDGFYRTFSSTNLSEISPDLFSQHPNATNFSWVFYDVDELTSIPGTLFANNAAITSLNQAFHGASITSIPSGLFDPCVEVTTFESAFEDCHHLTTIPSGLFDSCTLVTNFAFCFKGCSALTTLPSGLFDYNTAATGLSASFNGTFTSCSALETVPNGLFKYTVHASFVATFRYCNKLQVNPWTFYLDGEQATRFAYTTNFMQTFDRSSFTGTQGTAPDLWNCTYGGGHDHSDTFNGAGNSATSLSNYASIPADYL